MKIPEPKKQKSGNYFIQLRLNGKSYSITKPTAKECIKEAEYIKAQYNAEKLDPAGNGKITLEKAIENYINARSSVLSPSTVAGYNVCKKNYFSDVMKKQLKDIDWQKAVNSMAKEYAPKTVKNAWRLVSSVLAENGMEVKKIALPQPSAEEHKFLTREQIKAFCKGVKDDPIEIPSLLMLNSLRRSEVAALTWDCVDLESGTITVKASAVLDKDNNLIVRKTAKTSASNRTIPIIIPQLTDALKAVEDKTGNVCTCHIANIYKAVNRICEQNKLPQVGCHGLRHSFCSLCYSIGILEKECMELGGWSDWGTMRKIYTHLDKQSTKAAADKLKSFFGDSC